MSSSSVSKKHLVLEIKNKAKISCSLKRHLSPRTVGTIMRSLPLEGHAHLMGKNIAYFETKVDSGTERARKEFKKGDVAFSSSSGSICFFIADSIPGKTMTPIGKLEDDIDALNNLKPGDVFLLYEDFG
ncbi:MAG: cyclophilin-like fold protein [Nitrosopumilus sp.]|nr:cyclophilin-like fold protein [Nitrosopumilus sp.]